jgi:ankyrin repeat protein
MLTLEEILSDAASLPEFQHLDDVSVDSRGKGGETPLHWMAVLGDAKAIEILMKNGAVVNAADHAGNTPLHEAVSLCHANAIDSLLKFGANAFQKNVNGITPYNIAEKDNSTKLLFKHLQHKREDI